MDVFIVMEFIMCDDYFYGYNENLLSVCASFDDAKDFLDAYIFKYNRVDSDDDEEYGRGRYGDENSCFSQIIRMQMGDDGKEILYDTSQPIKDDELCTSDDIGDRTDDLQDK